MAYSTIFIDLDETVYPTTCGVWDAISVRMEQYMHDQLRLPLDEIPSMRYSLFQTYGTTLRGLQTRFHINTVEFLDYVHDVPLDQLLAPDPQLREVLQRYPARKIVLTNADRNHAARVIERLALNGCFESTIDIYDLDPYCKPMAQAFHVALERAGEKDPSRCVFIDDSPRNLQTARDLGFYTIQVGSPKAGFSHPPACAHAIIPSLHQLPTVLDPLV